MRTAMIVLLYALACTALFGCSKKEKEQPKAEIIHVDKLVENIDLILLLHFEFENTGKQPIQVYWNYEEKVYVILSAMGTKEYSEQKMNYEISRVLGTPLLGVRAGGQDGVEDFLFEKGKYTFHTPMRGSRRLNAHYLVLWNERVHLVISYKDEEGARYGWNALSHSSFFQ